MKKTLFLTVLAVLAVGCGSTRPMTRAEMWPKFNTDPTLGIVILDGSASSTIKFINAATNEPLKEWSDRGESPALYFNGRNPIRIYITNVPKGTWKLEVDTFYYQSYLFRPRRLIPLYHYTNSIVVGNNPRVIRDDYYTQAEWGWWVYIYTGDVWQQQQYDYGYQLPAVDIQTTGIANDAVEFIRRLFR